MILTCIYLSKTCKICELGIQIVNYDPSHKNVLNKISASIFDLISALGCEK